jgi:predicted kinase
MFLIEEALCAGHSVVVDNTNPTTEDRTPIITLARSYGATVTGYFFDAPLEECLERNSRRTGKERVPDRALHIAAKRLQPPLFEEGFDRLFRVRLTPEGEFMTSEALDPRVP